MCIVLPLAFYINIYKVWMDISGARKNMQNNPGSYQNYLTTPCSGELLYVFFTWFFKTLFQFIYLFILSLYFILLTGRKATEMLIHRTSNYPDLLFQMPKYCCPVEIFYLFFSFFRDMTAI